MIDKEIRSYESVKEEVRKRQLRILDVVAGICEKEGLDYWLDAGTLLGAVRHKGYIPWDDDIDIGLMRRDYERLLSLLEKELPGDMVLQTLSSDPLYGFMYAKVRDRHSHVHGDKEYVYNGIFVDIFPFDAVSKYEKVRRVQYAIVQTIVGLRYAVRFRPRRLLLKKVLKFLVDCNWVYRSLYGLAFFLNRLGTDERFVGNGLVCPWAFDRSVRPRECYLPVKEVEFEGKRYRAPHDSDLYLKSLYGDDYMTPRKEAHTEHMAKITFLDHPA